MPVRQVIVRNPLRKISGLPPSAGPGVWQLGSGFRNWQSAGQVPDSCGRIPWNVPLLKVYVRRAHGYSFLHFPDRCILTGRYHFGRERAKTCQYIHLVSCVAMFCEVAPARGIPFREGTSASVSQHILCKLRESHNDVTGAVNWKSERLLTFPCRDVVLGKCGQSECHGAI